MAAACEIDPICRRVIRLCHTRSARPKNCSRTSTFGHPQELPDHDFYVAGFPCQPFSTMGVGQGMNDARGRGLIINHIISALAVKRPRAFLLENVKGLVTQHQATLKQNLQRLRHMAGSAYKVGFKIIDTADFGIPQHRERVYIVGLLRDAMVPGFSFTWPTPRRRIPLGTALGWRKTRQTRGAKEGGTISSTRHAQAATTSQTSLAQHPPEGRGPQGSRPPGGGGHRWEQTSLDARDESLLDTCEGVHRALLTSSWAEVDNPRTVATPSAAC